MSTTPPPVDPGTLPVTGYQLTAAMQALGQQLSDAAARLLAAMPPTLASLAQRSDVNEARLAALETLLYDPASGLVERVTALEAAVKALKPPGA